MLDAAMTWQYETSLARLIAKDCFSLNQRITAGCPAAFVALATHRARAPGGRGDLDA